MRVLLYDHSGCLNRGCEAIVRSTVKIIEKASPDSEFILCSYSAKEDSVLSDIKNLTVVQLSPRSLKIYEKPVNALNVKLHHSFSYYYSAAYSDFPKLAADCDVCLIIGGDTFCYGDNELCRELTRILKRKGKKVVLWGGSVDSDKLTDKKLETLLSLDAVFARESLTKDLLESKGVSNIFLYPDPAFVLEANETPQKEKGTKLLGINLSQLAARRTENLGRSAAQFLYYIERNTDYTPLLIPHVSTPGNDDPAFLAAIAKAAKSEKSILLPADLTARDYKSYISGCDMFIGARTHSLIAAYSSLVPAFAISYSFKGRGIAKDLFGQELCVKSIRDILSGRDLLACFEELCENKEKMKTTLEKQIPETLRAAYAAGETLKNIL